MTMDCVDIQSVLLHLDPEKSPPEVLLRDREQAIADLERVNLFRPVGVPCGEGPFVLHLGIEGNYLYFRLRSDDDTQDVQAFILSLSPYRRLIRDYFFLIDSYVTSATSHSPFRLEAMDMGRRALHNEGAELLMARLSGKIETDFATARRLFTLICTLQGASPCP